MRNQLLLGLSVLCLCTTPVAVFADEPYHQPLTDKVEFTLSAEDWVETSTARVTMEINATLPGSDADKVRSGMLKAVNGLVSDAKWRFTSFDHSEDQSQLETWHAEVEARLKEADLGGLRDKARDASKPGMQIKIANIEFTPTLAESEAAKANVRNEIYGQVNDELKRLNTAEPGRNFHVGEIAFNGPVIRPMPRVIMANAMAGGAAQAPEAPQAPIDIEQKVTITARVTLEALAPKE